MLFDISAKDLCLEQANADEATADRVYAALNADPLYYYRHVDVRVDDGVAQLNATSGTQMHSREPSRLPPRCRA